MMDFGLLPAASLLVLAASGDPVCRAPKPTEISVAPVSTKVQLHTDKSLAELQGVETATINPHSFGGVSVMQGYAQASIKAGGETKLDYAPAEGYRDAICIWYDKITIRFDVDPSIHLAKEVYKDRCMRKAVYDHEMKHVMPDRKLINQYSNIVARKLSDQLRQRGFVVGPIPIDQAEGVAARMQQTVGQILELEFKRFELDRAEAQGRVDSLEEYQRVSKLCPLFKVPDDVIQSGGRNAYRGR